MLRGYCDYKQLDLITIEEDDGSAAGAQDHVHWDGYREAISRAKAEGAMILVPSVDRLARHPNVLPEIIDNNLQVISASHGRRLSRKVLKSMIDRAQRERDLISQRAREGAVRAKKRGVNLGNKKNLEVAQRNGAIANVGRADRKVQELSDFIERTPGWQKMTLRDKVAVLNSSGLLNLVSEKRGERQPWTLSSIRKPLKKAEAELALREELEEHDAIVASGFCPAGDQDVKVASVDRHNEDVLVDDPDAPLCVVYKHHPDFGKF